MSNGENNDCIQVDIKEFVDGKIKDIRDIIDSRFNEITHRIEYRAQVAETALKEAKSELGSRLAGMNEFRDTIKDLIAQFATRTELEGIKSQIKDHIGRAEHAALCDRVTLLEKAQGKYITSDQHDILIEKMNNQRPWIIGGLITLILVLIGVIIDIMRKT